MGGKVFSGETMCARVALLNNWTKSYDTAFDKSKDFVLNEGCPIEYTGDGEIQDLSIFTKNIKDHLERKQPLYHYHRLSVLFRHTHRTGASVVASTVSAGKRKAEDGDGAGQDQSGSSSLSLERQGSKRGKRTNAATALEELGRSLQGTTAAIAAQAQASASSSSNGECHSLHVVWFVSLFSQFLPA